MVNKQPEAMRLAKILEKMPLGECDQQAADELRRLYAVNQELLGALKRILDEPNNTMSDGKALKEIIKIARASIAKATGETE